MYAKLLSMLLFILIFAAYPFAAEGQPNTPSSGTERDCGVEGVVLDEYGNPVTKAEVTLIDLSSNVKVTSVKTDKKGHYSFTELARSSYRAQASKGGRESDPSDFSFTDPGVRKQNLQLKSK